jgi:excisionase family DNA binding protein
VSAVVVLSPEDVERLIERVVARTLDARATQSRPSDAGAYMTTKSAGAALHLCDREVRRLVKQGRLRAVKRSAGQSGRLLIARDSVEQYLNQRSI